MCRQRARSRVSHQFYHQGSWHNHSCPTHTHVCRHEPHFCLLRESGRLEAVLEAAPEDEEGAEDAPFWSPVRVARLLVLICGGCLPANNRSSQSKHKCNHPPVPPPTLARPPQVGQQPLELLRLSTLRDFLRCEFAEFVADPAEQQQQGQQQQGRHGQAGQAAGAGGVVAGPGAGSASEAEGGVGGSTSGGDSTGGSPAGVAGLAPGAGGGSDLSSLDGNEEGEVDLITGEKKRVHPSVLRRLAKKAAKAQHAQQVQQQQDEVGQAEPTGLQESPVAPLAAAAGGSGGGGKGGARFDFERV